MPTFLVNDLTFDSYYKSEWLKKQQVLKEGKYHTIEQGPLPPLGVPDLKMQITRLKSRSVFTKE